jgi:hypothetical protein
LKRGGASKDLHHQQKGRHGGVAALDLHRLSGRGKLSIVVVTTIWSSAIRLAINTTSAAVIVVKATCDGAGPNTNNRGCPHIGYPCTPWARLHRNLFKPSCHWLIAFLRNGHNGSWMDIKGATIGIDEFSATARSGHHPVTSGHSGRCCYLLVSLPLIDRHLALHNLYGSGSHRRQANKGSDTKSPHN